MGTYRKKYLRPERFEKKEMNYCIWNKEGVTPCKRAANQIIIYGCLDQHLTEYPYCWEHRNLWETYFKKKIVVCTHQIMSSEVCNKIIVEWDYVEI
jgi:hypothetical protein